MRIFVLLFNIGTDNERIHTIQMGDQNKILMFESEDDAIRFGLMLEAQDFPTPSVEEFDEEEIKAFCDDTQYEWELVPGGALAIPPERNVEQIDWDEEDVAETTVVEEEPSEFSASELERIRRQLEGLL